MSPGVYRTRQLILLIKDLISNLLCSTEYELPSLNETNDLTSRLFKARPIMLKSLITLFFSPAALTLFLTCSTSAILSKERSDFLAVSYAYDPDLRIHSARPDRYREARYLIFLRGYFMQAASVRPQKNCQHLACSQKPWNMLYFFCTYDSNCKNHSS